MTTTTGPGTGPAGRRLLAELDRLLDHPRQAVELTYAGGGCYRASRPGHVAPLTAHRYRAATFDHLARVGLIEVDYERGAVRLTPLGIELLGA